MKRFIKGRLYDTEVAEEICEESQGVPGDIAHYSVTLYKTKEGQFFMAGYGGQIGLYAKTTGDMACGGFRLWLVDEEYARKFTRKQHQQSLRTVGQ